jgi:mannose-6-phosphate isomerase-like protein (cupin superfamily)
MTPQTPSRLTVADAAAQLALAQQANDQTRFITLVQRGSLAIEIYVPQEVDLQKPHRQDELYVIISGQGEFLNGDQRHPFGPGDVLFVPAGVPHRFENFSADFQTWVIFYGPDGGEQPEQA